MVYLRSNSSCYQSVSATLPCNHYFRVLCSLAKVDEAAQWEDVTDTVSVRSRTKGLQFDTKVSAAFWLLVCRDAATPATVLRTAEIMYRHVARRHPYVARLSVFYRVVRQELTPEKEASFFLEIDFQVKLCILRFPV